MGIFGKLLKIGSVGAAPFTGGSSLALASLVGAKTLGGILENRQGARTGTTSPTLNPAYTSLRDILLKQALARSNAPTALPAGYLEGGIQNINQTSNLANENLQNRLLGMGLSDSPVAANAFLRADLARQGALNTFQNIQAPEFENQLRQQNFQNAYQLLGQGTGTQTVYPGSAAGAGFSDAADLLAFLHGKRLIGGGNPGTFKGGTKYQLPGMGTWGITPQQL